MIPTATTKTRRALQVILRAFVVLVLVSTAGAAMAGGATGHGHVPGAAGSTDAAAGASTAAVASMPGHGGHVGHGMHAGTSAEGDGPCCEPAHCDLQCGGACPASGAALTGASGTAPCRPGSVGSVVAIGAHDPSPRFPDVPFRPPIGPAPATA